MFAGITVGSQWGEQYRVMSWLSAGEEDRRCALPALEAWWVVEKWLRSESSRHERCDLYCECVFGFVGDFSRMSDWEICAEIRRGVESGRVVVVAAAGSGRAPRRIDGSGVKKAPAPEPASSEAAESAPVDAKPAAKPKPIVAKPPPGAVTEAEAKKLFEELRSQPQIPFDYPVDCCYSRAHEMCRIMEGKGVKCEKYWFFNKGWGTGSSAPDLHPTDGRGRPILFPDENAGVRRPVRWVYHVAPLIEVMRADGTVEKMIMDPSIMKGPSSTTAWRQVQGNPPGAYSEVSDSKAYFSNKKLNDRLEDPTGEKTTTRLLMHRMERDELLQAERKLNLKK